MIRRLRQKFRRDNRGSAIVVVMVSMTFIVVLASILLYLSLVNIQMKNTDQSGKKSFYDAEAVMNEVRANIQYIVSEAIDSAYTDVLNNYNNDTEEEREARLRDGFYTALYTQAIKMPDENDAEKVVESIFKSDVEYYPARLAELLGNVPGVEFYDPGNETETKTVSHSDDGDYITLEDVTVAYTSSKGFYTKVTADIVIKAPTLKSVSSTITYSNIPDFSIIAEDSMDAASGAEVSGNAYAGSVTVNGNGSLAVSGSDFVCAGDVTVSNDAALAFADSANLWANSIILENKGVFEAAGYAYIANDLNLHGQASQATLTGRYFGYGNATDDPDMSSSIIVNGRDTTLDMGDIKTLVLAGRSFVNYGSQEFNSGTVMMGQSVAVKSDQLAYLVPANCLGVAETEYGSFDVTNPFEYYEAYHGDPGNDVLQSLVLLDQEVIPGQSEEETGKTLTDYGITSADILCMRKVVGAAETGTRLIYFCMQFPTPEMANAYFADYFSANATDIQKYLDIYCQSYELADNMTLGAAGGVYDYNTGEVLDLIGGTTIPEATLNTLKQNYAYLCITLSKTDDGGDSGAESPYEYYVDTTALGQLSGTINYALGGEDRVVVTTSIDYRVSSAASSVNVIISSNNVIVDRDFTGLIIAGGKVTLNGTVTADRDVVAEALQASVNADGTAYYYLNPEHFAPASPNSTNDDIWDMNALVTYENWTKNEE